MDDQEAVVALQRSAGHIRSFVRRQGRVSNAQQRYHEEMMAASAFPTRGTRVDLDALFGRRRRGFSKSVSAWARPRRRLPRRTSGNDYLGIEVHTPGVGSLCKLVAELGLPISASSSTTRSRCCAT
jgi:tRNA (guanine-N7-)-methyltransferase